MINTTYGGFALVQDRGSKYIFDTKDSTDYYTYLTAGLLKNDIQWPNNTVMEIKGTYS